MERSELKTVLYNSRVTIISGLLIAVFNAGFISGSCCSQWYNHFCSIMEFNRDLIMEGEIWRLVTGHLIHWSPAHFYLDSMVFIFQGITFEKKIGSRYWLILLLSALFISIALLLLRQDLFYYRGVSGIINTQLVLGAGLFIMDRSLDRVTRGMFAICFSIHMIKIIYETACRIPLFSTHLLGDMGLFTPTAHLSGVAAGFFLLLFYMWPLSKQMQMAAQSSKLKINGQKIKNRNRYLA